jgi:serine O-acetyltransferase
MSEHMDKSQLLEYVNLQLNHFFPDNYNSKPILQKNLPEALDRAEFSIKHVKLNGYMKFNHLQSDLYAQFIYFLSNTVWKNDQDNVTCEKLFGLNKALNGLNCMYDTILPDIFLLIHCVGTVLGKAHYADYFVACQNVTVGSDRGKSPQMNGPLYMGPGSSIIGECTIGPFTHLTIGCSVLKNNTPSNSLVVVKNGSELEYKESKRNLIKEIYFNYNV